MSGDESTLAALRLTGGYFTLFWEYETQGRTASIERLTRAGRIVVYVLDFPRLRAIIK